MHKRQIVKSAHKQNAFTKATSLFSCHHRISVNIKYEEYEYYTLAMYPECFPDYSPRLWDMAVASLRPYIGKAV